ncbi:hypothetical protein CU097_003143, partial [Rhizopus azygosporus]
MDDINTLLEQTGLSSIQSSGLAIISIFGVSDNTTQASPAILANRIVGSAVFSHRKESIKEGTIELVKGGLQLYVDLKANTVYLFLDSAIDTSILGNQHEQLNIAYSYGLSVYQHEEFIVHDDRVSL